MESKQKPHCVMGTKLAHPNKIGAEQGKNGGGEKIRTDGILTNVVDAGFHYCMDCGHPLHMQKGCCLAREHCETEDARKMRAADVNHLKEHFKKRMRDHKDAEQQENCTKALGVVDESQGKHVNLWKERKQKGQGQSEIRC